MEDVTLTGASVVGSVYILHPARYRGSTEPALVAQATDGGSVFDVGTFYEIPGSGAARNTLRHRAFTEMSDRHTWQAMGEEDFAACFSDQEQVEGLMASPMFEDLKTRGMLTHHIGMIDRRSGEIMYGGHRSVVRSCPDTQISDHQTRAGGAAGNARLRIQRLH